MSERNFLSIYSLSSLLYLNCLKTTHPHSRHPGPVLGKTVFHETSPWCQKAWGLLLWATGSQKYSLKTPRAVPEILLVGLYIINKIVLIILANSHLCVELAHGSTAAPWVYNHSCLLKYAINPSFLQDITRIYLPFPFIFLFLT